MITGLRHLWSGGGTLQKYVISDFIAAEVKFYLSSSEAFQLTLYPIYQSAGLTDLPFYYVTAG